MENNEVIWEYYKLSREIPGMEDIRLVKHDYEDLTIEASSFDGKGTLKAVFPAASVITYRRMKDHDTYNFPEEERSDAGFLSVSNNSAFLKWYRGTRLFDTEAGASAMRVRSYLISTDSDVMEVISYAPPKVYHDSEFVAAVEEEEKKDKD